MATVKYKGKDIPLTNAGLPNLVYLSKDEREVVRAYGAKQKKEKKAIAIKELTDLLGKL